jgi:hypothetical protein
VQLVFDSDGLAGILQVCHILMQFLSDLGEHLHDLVVVRLVSECPFDADAFSLLPATGCDYVFGYAQMGFTTWSARPYLALARHTKDHESRTSDP